MTELTVCTVRLVTLYGTDSLLVGLSTIPTVAQIVALSMCTFTVLYLVLFKHTGEWERPQSGQHGNWELRLNYEYAAMVLPYCGRGWNQPYSTVKVHMFSATICATVGIVLSPTRRLSIPNNHTSRTVPTVKALSSIKNYTTWGLNVNRNFTIPVYK